MNLASSCAQDFSNATKGFISGYRCFVKVSWRSFWHPLPPFELFTTDILLPFKQREFTPALWMSQAIITLNLKMPQNTWEIDLRSQIRITDLFIVTPACLLVLRAVCWWIKGYQKMAIYINAIDINVSSAVSKSEIFPLSSVKNIFVSY